MTIRYECPGCGAVLKIRDEKVGKPGKCPACKTAFTIPDPGEVFSVAAAGADGGAPIEDDGEFVDMPLEMTPDIDLPEDSPSSHEFDPMGVLNAPTPAPPGKKGSGKSTDADEHRPTVAELMRDHQATRKKEAETRARRQEKKVNSLLAETKPAGSAADAITRSYEKKRGNASEAPPLSREERRAAEQRAAFLRFAVQAALGLVVVVGLAWGFSTWLASGGGPGLVDVTGTVTLRNKPLPNVRVQFAPVREPGGPEPTGGPSSARTNAEGEFTLLYDSATRGAVVGLHEVSIDDPSGIPILPPSLNSRREVTTDGDNHFEFNL